MLDELPTSRYASPLVATFIENRSILVKFASRFLGCRSHAEDVVQDTFFRLQNASSSSIPLKAQMSYLFQVVRNLAIDHYRKQALEQRHTGAPQELMEAESEQIGLHPEKFPQGYTGINSPGKNDGRAIRHVGAGASQHNFQ